MHLNIEIVPPSDKILNYIPLIIFVFNSDLEPKNNRLKKNIHIFENDNTVTILQINMNIHNNVSLLRMRVN